MNKFVTSIFRAIFALAYSYIQDLVDKIIRDTKGSTAVVDLRFAELDPHADVFWQNIPIWPALKKKLRSWPYQCCSDQSS